ncbi:MAG: class I SAM-dependent rRNA methyltransferase [Chloroflexota bacterium]
MQLDFMPLPSEKRLAIRVTKQAEQAIRQGHPWVFASAIQSPAKEGKSGDLAVIFDRKRRFLAIGLYNPTSPIRVRILHSGSPITIDDSWFADHLRKTISKRDPLLSTNTNGYRLVSGENDGLPGLVIDRYADTCVLKLYTPAWVPHLRSIVPPLLEETQAKRVVLRMSRAVQKEVDTLHGLSDGMILHGDALDGPVIFLENGLRFEADPIVGQKTGFFLDQRDNRARVEQLVVQEQAHDVLNVFAYTGGFSLYAARGGASRVTSLDISKPALAAAERNFALNHDQPNIAHVHHEILAADAFKALSEMARSGKQFDMVIIDPPAFAKKQNEIEGALSAYARLTKLGLRVTKKGGTIVLASCSSRVDADTFFNTIREAARQSRRPMKELSRTGHALDHSIGFPEGAYLKCLFAKV